LDVDGQKVLRRSQTLQPKNSEVLIMKQIDPIADMSVISRVKMPNLSDESMREHIEKNGKSRELCKGVTVKEGFHNEAFAMIYKNEDQFMEFHLKIELELHNFTISGKGPNDTEIMI
jgi:hypothetical protein